MGDAEDRTCYVSNFTQEVTSDLLEELFTQVGPLERVSITEKNGYRFAMVMFEDEESVPFAVTTLDGIHMFGTPLTVKPRNGSKHDTGRRSFESKRREPYPMHHSSSYPDSRKRDYNGRNSSFDERYDNHYRASSHTPSMAVLTPPPPPPPPPPNSYPSFKTRPVPSRSESYNTPKSSFTGRHGDDFFRPGGDQRRTFPSKPSDTRVFENDSNGRDRWRDRGRGDRYSFRNSSVSSGSSSRSSREFRRY